MGHALKQLRHDDRAERWTVVASHESGIRTILAGHVISSAPMRELASRLHPVPAGLADAAALKYREFLTVALFVRGEDLFPDN